MCRYGLPGVLRDIDREKTLKETAELASPAGWTIRTRDTVATAMRSLGP